MLSTPEDTYIANYFGALDCINNGITTVLDHSHVMNSPAHADGAIKGLKAAGLRGTWCYGLYANPDRSDLASSDHDASVATPKGFDHEARLKDAKRTREQYFPVNDPEKELLTFGGAPTEAEGMPAEVLRQEIDFFRSIGARIITMHVGMGTYDVGNQIVGQLGRDSYLGKDLVFSHGAEFTDAELELIRDSGAGISATPETELQMGMGHPIAFKAADCGCHVGLGIDITSNQNNDILAAMRLGLQAERGRRQQAYRGKQALTEITPTSEEALYMTTLGGAKVIGLDHLIGSITPGKRADIIITNGDDMNVVPMISPIGNLMFNAHIGNIDTVMIEGKIVKEKSQVLNVDWPSLRKDVRERTARMVRVANTVKQGSKEAAWKKVFTE